MRHDQSLHQAAGRLVNDLQAVQQRLAALTDEQQFDEVAAALDRLLATCRRTGIWGLDNRVLSSQLWNVAGEWLSRGWLQNRARTKPRGYAGDYELLSRMFHEQLCDDPLGRQMDRYFQRNAAPVAVRNRMAMMARWIVERIRSRSERTTRVAVVGSAFGLDVRAALLEWDAQERANVAVVLLDLDPDAVEFGRTQLEPLLPAGQVTAVACNLFRLPQRPKLAAPLAGIDLLFCPGIFDYLDDVAGAAMLRLFWERLAPGGRMTVFQFAPHNPSRALMEWIGNWYLLYRTPDEFRRLVEAAGIPASAATYGAEPLGVDLYVTAMRT